MERTIRNLTIFGSGLMGIGIAQVFAHCPELSVTVYALDKAAADVPGNLRSNLQPFVDRGLHTPEEAARLIDRVHVTEDRAGAIGQADLIIECVFEDMALKQAIFEEFETFGKPDALFASNTSVMSIDEIGSRMQDKSRLVGTHFWNPPYLIPLVEVVRGTGTAEATMAAVMSLLRRAGKRPIYVKKDVPGFVANRLQHALWREAFSIVERGIADAETVDEALRYGPGLRLPILAPLENADMIGLDLTLAIHSYILQHLEDSHEPSRLLKEKVAEGNLGFKSGAGFMAWPPEAAAASRRRLSDYLIGTVIGESNHREGE